MDAIDRQILTLLVQDGRRTYDDIATRVALSAPSVKRRVDRLQAELFFAPGTQLEEVAVTLGAHPEVVEAWSVTGEADAIARVRTLGNADLERLIRDLQRDGSVVRTRSQVVLSALVTQPAGA